MNVQSATPIQAGRISYGFARDKGVALIPGDPPVFALRRGADPFALIEARRAAGYPFAVREMDAADDMAMAAE